MPKGRPAYIAIARSFIRDLRFRRPADRPLTELEATIWLIAESAWKPRGSPTRFGAIHNERSQLSTTERLLAKDWSWSKSKVHRVLGELVRDGTIRLEFCRPGPETRAGNEAKRGYARSLITLINYDKFQGAAGVVKPANHKANQKVNQNSPELPGLIYTIASKPAKQHESDKSLPGSVVPRPRPTHGKRWRDKICIHYGTEDWKIYSDDYEAVTGAAMMPVTYINGRAQWFVAQGEATRNAG
jgi:hypothetical protein